MNLEDKGMPEPVARFALDYMINEIVTGFKKSLPFFSTLDDARQGVLVDMAFNLGMGGLYGFVDTLKLIKEKKYRLASYEMLNSEWASQVGNRATTLSRMMETGKWPGEF
jgi:lysozyme